MSMKVDAGGLLATATGLSNITNASDVICYLNYGKKCPLFENKSLARCKSIVCLQVYAL